MATAAVAAVAAAVGLRRRGICCAEELGRGIGQRGLPSAWQQCTDMEAARSCVGGGEAWAEAQKGRALACCFSPAPKAQDICRHACTVVMLKQPGHLTSMKKELGDCTSRLSLCRRCSSSLGGCSRSTSPIEMKLMVARGGARGVDAAVRYIYVSRRAGAVFSYPRDTLIFLSEIKCAAQRGN